MNFSLSAQDCFAKIEQSLIDCGLLIHSRNVEFDIKRLIIETDSINSKNYSKITAEPFDESIGNLDYNKIDSLIKLKYNGLEVLSSQRTSENYGVLYCYVINNSNGNPYFDRCVIKYIDNKPMLIIYSAVMGNNIKNFEKFECMINKIK